MPDQTQICPQCGTRLKPGATDGLCLRCLLSFGLKDDAVPDEADESTGEFPDTFDRFRIIAKIGEGGCGVVYRAEQREPVRREVALKVIKLGMDTGSVIARFEAERQALAMMDHPGIAKVFDAGRSRQGRPFFAMELVHGERITDFCDRRQLSIPQRLELFARVCEAVQHAHQKGIIHRDLKPSNILVAGDNGAPGIARPENADTIRPGDARRSAALPHAQPKVIDFGIAKATSRQRLADHTIYTAFDQFIGTPAYMSPEQAGATGEAVDTRSDIYSLGVLLYELLTGRPPFEPERLRQAAVDEVFRIIRDEDPARPSARLTQELTLRVRPSGGGRSARETGPGLTDARPPEGGTSSRGVRPPQAIKHLITQVRGDLDWIVMKALEKLPSRRYETASALAAEVRRHLNHEPVLARPPSASYRLGKTLRRNKLAFTAATTVLVTLLAGAGISTWQFFQEREARKLAATAEQKALAEAARAGQVARFLKDMLAGVQPDVALGRDTTLLREILDRTAERVSRELKDHPDIEAELRAAIGLAYWNIGEFGKAEAMHREGLRLREEFYPPTDAAVLESLLNLIAVLNYRGRGTDLIEGESLARRAVALQKSRVGASQPAEADALLQLAWNLFRQKRYAEAETAYRQVLSDFRRSQGARGLGIVNVLHTLGAILTFDPNRLDEAEALTREALELQRKAHPLDHPYHADVQLTLSMVLEKRQKLPEAENAIRECLRIRRKLLGPENEMLASPLQQLANILTQQDKFAEAEAAFREVIAIETKASGRAHSPASNGQVGKLTELLRAQKKWPEAETSAAESVASARAEGMPKTTLMHALHWQSIIFTDQGKWTEAGPPLREALALCDRLSSAPQSSVSHLLCVHMRRSLGESLFRQKQFTEAEPLLLSSHESLKNATGRWDIVNAELSLKHLVELYEATARPAQAAEWKQKLTDFQKAQAEKLKAVSIP